MAQSKRMFRLGGMSVFVSIKSGFQFPGKGISFLSNGAEALQKKTTGSFRMNRLFFLPSSGEGYFFFPSRISL
jgi:hypothetical protein